MAVSMTWLLEALCSGGPGAYLENCEGSCDDCPEECSITNPQDQQDHRGPTCEDGNANIHPNPELNVTQPTCGKAK
jgi:hypothetical protein